jgi:hypothetical protein
MRDDATGSDRSGSGRGGFLAEPEMRGPATCRAAYGGVRAFVAESFDAAPHLYKRGETSVQPDVDCGRFLHHNYSLYLDLSLRLIYHGIYS